MSLEAWGDEGDYDDSVEEENDPSEDQKPNWSDPFWEPWDMPPEQEFSSTLYSNQDKLFTQHIALLLEWDTTTAMLQIGDLVWIITSFDLTPHFDALAVTITFRCIGYVDQYPTRVKELIRLSPLMLPMG